MRILMLRLALLLATLWAGAATPARASEFVPWERGDSAVYRSDDGAARVFVEIDRSFRNWRHYTNFAGLGPLWVGTSPSNERVYVWSRLKRRVQLFADFEAPAGQASSIDILPCNRGTVTIEEKPSLSGSLGVGTRAGIFLDAIRLDLETSCSSAGVTSMWFVPGVGFVRWLSQSVEGPVGFGMIEGTIGGTVYPIPRELKIDASVSTTRVWISFRDLHPPSVEASLTIANNTTRALTFQFSTGQSFEIEFIDRDGHVVSTASRGQVFTQAFRTETLGIGETWTFRGSVNLTRPDGEPLPFGGYTVKIELLGALRSLGSDPFFAAELNPAPISATAPVEIALDPSDRAHNLD